MHYIPLLQKADFFDSKNSEAKERREMIALETLQAALDFLRMSHTARFARSISGMASCWVVAVHPRSLCFSLIPDPLSLCSLLCRRGRGPGHL